MDGGLMREYAVDFNLPLSELGDFGFHLQAMHTKGEQERIKQGLLDLHTWVFVRLPHGPSARGATYGWMLGPPPGGKPIEPSRKTPIEKHRERSEKLEAKQQGVIEGKVL